MSMIEMLNWPVDVPCVVLSEPKISLTFFEAVNIMNIVICLKFMRIILFVEQQICICGPETRHLC